MTHSSERRHDPYETTLETPRLILRGFTPADLDSLHAILSDQATMRFWPAPFEYAQTAAWLSRILRHYEHHGFGRMAVTLRTTGALIGDCGIVTAVVSGRPENDLGYIMDQAYHGQGYGTEAAGACLRAGFEMWDLPRVCANMPTDHAASRRVAEKIGMRLESQFHNPRNRGILTCLYALWHP